MEIKVDQTKRLVNEVKKCFDDPLRFVMTFWPWGVAGTPLENENGPDQWQSDFLCTIGEKVKARVLGEIEGALRFAVASGHGIGKGTIVAWLIHWFMATRPSPEIVVTANTSQQLTNKTWRELAKWHRMCLIKDWFSWTATKFYYKQNPATWFAVAAPWSKERSDAFQGTHEAHVLMIFDEASMIDQSIWDAAEGAMTTPGAMWFAFGNPTRNTGAFYNCFNGKVRDRWTRYQIDSRNAKKADKNQIKQWIDDYGEDSDFVRVRVRGVFPRTSSMQLIGNELVEEASKRVITERMIEGFPVVIGVDVARFGDDQSVIYVRKGKATLAMRTFRGIDTITLAGIVARVEKEFKADAVFVDDVGVGGGVVDYLRNIGRSPLSASAGSRAIEDTKYSNKRAEMWDKMRQWLEEGGQIPNEQDLKNDLTGPEYGFDSKDRLQLETKECMKRRGLHSPDMADALAHTFAAPVERKEDAMNAFFMPQRAYDPMTFEFGGYGG